MAQNKQIQLFHFPTQPVALVALAFLIATTGCNDESTNNEHSAGHEVRNNERFRAKPRPATTSSSSRTGKPHGRQEELDVLSQLTNEELQERLDGLPPYSLLDEGRKLIENELKSPEELLELLSTLEDKNVSGKLRIELIRNLGATNPTKALELCKLIPPGRELVLNYSALIDSSPPDQLLRVYSEIVDENMSDVNSAIETHLGSRLHSLPENILSEIASHPDKYGVSLKNNAEASIGALNYQTHGMKIPSDSSAMTTYGQLATAVSKDPVNAAAWISRNIHDEKVSEAIMGDLLDRVVVNLANRSNQNAIKWASELPEEVRANTIRTAVDLWLRDDSIAVSSWAASLPNGQVRNIAALAIAQNLVEVGDMESARQWAGAVDDPSLKEAAGKILSQQ